MSKNRNIWIIPAEQPGWEVWKKNNAGLLSLSATEEKLTVSKGEITQIFLPVHNVITQVERVFKAEDSLEIQTVMTNLEMNPLIKDARSIYRFYQDETYSYYACYYIDTIEVEKSWKKCKFNFSPVAYSSGNNVVLCQEHGQWVFICYYNGVVIHAQTLGLRNLEKSFLSELRAFIFHLQSLGVSYEPTKLLTTHSGLAALPGFEVVKVTRGSLVNDAEIEVDLLAFQVVEWQQQERLRGKITAVITLLLAMLLMIIAILFYQQWQLKSDIAEYRKTINKHKSTVEQNREHMEKWEELSSVVETDWSLKYYAYVSDCIPARQTISLDLIDITQGAIKITGRSSTFAKANAFGANLKKHPDLALFEWKVKAPVAAPGGYFTFFYEAGLKEGGE